MKNLQEDFMNKEKNMPVLFVGHGSPMNAIENSPARAGWKKMGKKLEKPGVILAVSAHWATEGTFVRTADTNRQIYDMYGFPEELYEVKYAPAGSPEYAGKVLNLLEGAAKPDNSWGIDHGVWSILCNMYPEADIPVVMISINVSASPDQLFETGRKLQPLRNEGAMILASGNVVHNLRMVNWDMQDGYEWADSFDTAIRDAILSGNPSIPLGFREIPDVQKAVPTVEHYAPLLVALGAVSETDSAAVFNEYRELGSMSMTSYVWE